MRYAKSGKRLLTVFCLLAALIMVFAIPGPAMAADKYMEGESADFQLYLNQAGDAEVTETWNCYFGGDTITRYRRYYLIPQGGDTNISITGVQMDGEDMTILDAPDDSRPVGCAAVWEEDNKMNVEMYLSALNESHSFTISYYATNVVILHEDVAEFRWNLTSTNEAFSVKKVTSHITIPYGTEDKGLYFWAHGPEENARFDAIVNEGMVNEFDLSLENVTPESPAHVRFAMPKEIFPEAYRQEHTEALDRIIAEESGESQNEPFDPNDPYGLYSSDTPDTPDEPDDPDDPDDVEVTYTLWDEIVWRFQDLIYNVRRAWTVIAIILCILPITFYVLLNRTFEKIARKKFLPKMYRQLRHTPLDNPEYYRSLPDDSKPALVYKLASIYPGDPESTAAATDGSAFSATVMDLIERDVLRMQKLWNGEAGYQLMVKPDAEGFTSYEKAILEMYSEAGAGEKPMTTKEVTDYMRAHYGWCKELHNSFEKGVDEDFNALNLTETHTQKKLSRPVYLTVMIASGLFIGLGTGGSSLFAGIPALIMGAVFGFLNAAVVSVIYDTLHPDVVILTQEGENQYVKWMAYARFLKNFTLFDEREIPDVVIWRRYLVYATALGCSKNIMEELKVKYPEVYTALMADPYMHDYSEFSSAAEEMDKEASYTVRSSSSGGDSSDSGGWGDVSDSGGGGDYDSGGGGSDFD